MARSVEDTARVVFNLRIDSGDLALYRRQAKAAGLSLSAWARAALEAHSGPPSTHSRPAVPTPQPSVSTSQSDRLASARQALAGATKEKEIPPRVLREIRATRDANPEMPHDEIARRFAARYPSLHAQAVLAALEMAGWA